MNHGDIQPMYTTLNFSHQNFVVCIEQDNFPSHYNKGQFSFTIKFQLSHTKIT